MQRTTGDGIDRCDAEMLECDDDGDADERYLGERQRRRQGEGRRNDSTSKGCLDILRPRDGVDVGREHWIQSLEDDLRWVGIEPGSGGLRETVSLDEWERDGARWLAGVGRGLRERIGTEGRLTATHGPRAAGHLLPVRLEEREVGDIPWISEIGLDR